MLENFTEDVLVPTQAEQPQSVPVVPSLQKPPHLLLGLFILGLGLLLAGGGYYFGRQAVNEPEQVAQPREITQNSVSPVTTNTPTPVTSPQIDDNAGSMRREGIDWQTHTNQRALYKVDYPNGWRVVSDNLFEGYGPVEIREDTLWSINTYSKDTHSISKIAGEIGFQFSDKKQSQEVITVNRLSAIKIVTTTASIPDWYSEVIIFEQGSAYHVLSNGANTNEALQKMSGVPSGTTFERFYNSFGFVN